jgi:hypothetical protein
MTLFGRLIGAHHVEDAAVALLRYWLPTYLHEVERQSGQIPGTLGHPCSYRVSGDTDKMPEDQTPAIVLKSPGIADEPSMGGSGVYQAQFRLEASAVVSARGGMEESGEPRALRLARMYALALRACLVQQADPDGYLFRRDWTGEEYDVLSSIDDRTVCVATTTFRIEVPDVSDANSGPVEPLVPPDVSGAMPPVSSPEWPTATEVAVEQNKVPIGEEMT